MQTKEALSEHEIDYLIKLLQEKASFSSSFIETVIKYKDILLSGNESDIGNLPDSLKLLKLVSGLYPKEIAEKAINESVQSELDNLSKEVKFISDIITKLSILKIELSE